jgi:hypothetical protein
MHITRKELRPLFVAALLILSTWLIGNHYNKEKTKTTTTPTIERHKYDTSAAVEYFDRRDANTIVVYVDSGSNGHLEYARFYDRDNMPRLTVYLSKSENESEQLNLDRINTGSQYTIVSGPTVFFWEKSAEGRALNSRYHEVVLAYKKLHPDENLPESESK